MRLALIAAAIALLYSPVAAQTAPPEFNDHTVHLVAKMAFDTHRNPNQVAQTQAACDAASRQRKQGKNAPPARDYCLIYEIALQEIAALEGNPNIEAIKQSVAMHMAGDFASLHIPQQDQQAFSNQLFQRTVNQLQILHAIATAPTRTYAKDDRMAAVQIARPPGAPAHAHLATSGPSCVGDVEGPVSFIGGALVMTRPDETTGPMDACALSMTLVGDDLLIRE